MFSNFSLVVRSSGIRLGLNPEDEEVKQKLAKCRPRVYSKRIRSDIPGPSGVSPSRALASRPSLPSVMKTSREVSLSSETHSGRAPSPSRVVGKEEEKR